MSMIELLKKGFGYLLMSMGVSSPTRKAGSNPKAVSGPKKAD